MRFLSRADEILLLAVLRLKENAYGVPIVKEVEKRTGKKITFGGLWVQMDNLCKKGYITKTIADPTPERGGRGKIYYTLTHKGEKALEQVRELNSSLWEDIPGSLKKPISD
ncbi:MAG: PadR family transcriptional regulator [bacterium]|nr:PadR family transcriptional regulator [bacterium]